MYAIKIKDILNDDVEAVRFVVTDIDRQVEAWKLAENLASSYCEHGLDRTNKTYWFKDQSGLHYIWAERQKPAAHDVEKHDYGPNSTLSLYERTEKLLHR